MELRKTEVVVTTGAITRAKLQSNCHHQQTNTQLFTGRMPFPVAQPTVSEHWQDDRGTIINRLSLVHVCLCVGMQESIEDGAVVMILANKLDLVEDDQTRRAVSTEAGHALAAVINNYLYNEKSAQRRRKHCALAVVRRTHKQTNTHRQGRLQYTAQLSAQCNQSSNHFNSGSSAHTTEMTHRKWDRQQQRGNKHATHDK